MSRLACTNNLVIIYRPHIWLQVLIFQSVPSHQTSHHMQLFLLFPLPLIAKCCFYSIPLWVSLCSYVSFFPLAEFPLQASWCCAKKIWQERRRAETADHYIRYSETHKWNGARGKRTTHTPSPFWPSQINITSSLSLLFLHVLCLLSGLRGCCWFRCVRSSRSRDS